MYRSKYRRSRNQNYAGSGPRNLNGGQGWDQEKGDYGKSNLNLPETERQTTQYKSPIHNVTSYVKAITAPLEDMLKTSNYRGKL